MQAIDPSTLDHSTLDPGSVRLRMKDGLKVALRHSGGGTWYLVEDARNGQFFRLGVEESTLLSLLDGQRTIQEVLALAAQFSGQSQLDEHRAAKICDFLLQAGLVTTAASRSVSRLQTAQRSAARSRNLKWLNPVCLSVPLVNPDRWFTILNRLTAWLPGWPTTLFACVVILAGLLQLAMHWDDLTLFRLRSYSAHDWLWLIVGWLVVKFFHECGHGLVCKRLGGTVPRGGIVLFLFVPLPFVDTTSSWAFAKRRDRMAVAAAGIGFEMFLAAVAMLAWTMMNPGPWRYHLEDIVMAAMVHTLLFNLNPLMKFDGYYLLSDALAIPNLSQRGKSFTSALLAKLFVDPTIKLPREPRLPTFVRAYGIAARGWMMLIWVSILVGACNLLEGVGLVFAGLALGGTLYPLVRNGIRQFRIDDRWHLRRLTHATRVTCGLVGVVALLGWLLPAPTQIVAPVVFDYGRQAVLRAQIEGFIAHIHVRSYQMVEQGDLLAELSNPPLFVRRQAIAAEAEACLIQARVHHLAGDIAAELAVRQQWESLNSQLSELEQLIGQMRIVAPFDGQVITPELGRQLNGYVNVGDEIVAIADVQSMEAIAMVDQTDANAFLQRTGNESGSLVSTDRRDWNATVLVAGVTPAQWPAVVRDIAPRATTQVWHRALAAPQGGMLDVIDGDAKRQASGDLLNVGSEGVLDRSNSHSASGYQLTQPRLRVSMRLSEDAVATVRSGQTGLALLAVRQQSLGSYAIERGVRWLRDQFQRSHGL